MSSSRTPNPAPIQKRNHDELQKKNHHENSNKRPKVAANPVSQAPDHQEQKQQTMSFAQFQHMLAKLKAANSKALMQNVLGQFELGKQHLRRLTMDSQQDQEKYNKIMSKFKLKSPACKLRQQLKQAMDELENDWQKQRQIELDHDKSDFALLNLITKLLTNEGFPPDLMQAITFFTLQITQIRTATSQREKDRDNMKATIMTCIFDEKRFKNYRKVAIESSLQVARNNILVNQHQPEPPIMATIASPSH